MTAFTLAVLLGAADIHVTYSGVPPAAVRDLETAVQIWERCIESKSQIRIHARWIPRGPTGYAFVRKTRDEPHLPIKGVYYPTALANALAGRRDGPQDDANIFLSGKTNWYFDSERPIEADQTDFINVAVHEIGHVLGVYSGTFIPWEGEPVATLGLPNPYDSFFSYTFPMDPQDGTPMVYDSFLRLADGRRLTDFPNSSVALAFALANPTIHFLGPEAIRANGGYPVGVTPANVAHIPKFPHRPTPIMLGDSGVGESIRHPDPILLGMLRDLGWKTRCDVQ